MSTLDVTSTDDGVIAVRGELNFSSALAARQAGEQQIAQSSGAVRFDFSGVHASGSVAVSVMMCWLRAAEAAGKAVTFSGVPEVLARIIAVSGLTGHLSVDETQTKS